MSKILFFLLVGIAVYLLLRAKRAPRRARRDTVDAAGAAAPEAMVSCAYCGLHIPASESLKIQELHYCGEEHRRLDVASQSR